MNRFGVARDPSARHMNVKEKFFSAFQCAFEESQEKFWTQTWSKRGSKSLGKDN